MTNRDGMGINLYPYLKTAHIIQRLYTTPLVSEFGASVPLKAPMGTLFFLNRYPEKKYDDTNLEDGLITQNQWSNPNEGEKLSSYNFNILRKEIEVKTERLKSVWTLEALQDFTAMFVENDNDRLEKTIADELTNECIFQLDNNFIKWLNDNSKKSTIDWDLGAYTSKLDMSFSLIDVIYENSLDMISRLHNKSSISVFATPNLCSVLMSHPNFKHHQRIDGTFDEDNFYFVGSINQIKIFCDFNNFLPNISKAPGGVMILGVRDLTNPVHSSVVFSPYKINIEPEVDANTGEHGIFVFYSYGITANPIHNKNDAAMLKMIEFTKAKPK